MKLFFALFVLILIVSADLLTIKYVLSILLTIIFFDISMRKVSLFFLLIFCCVLGYAQPKICLTFDDGKTTDIGKYKSEVWNKMLLDTLDKYNVQAALFVKAKGLDDDKGRTVLKQWDDAGHIIANHTYSHKNYNSTTFEFYRDDFLRCDSFINGYKNFTKLFRFPYLKEGKTREKIDQFRAFLKTQGYKNGYVTADASDWYIDSRLSKAVKKDSTLDIKGYEAFYTKHLYTRAIFYDSLAKQLTGRQISHTLLLHHNLSSALFVGTLIRKFRDNGWEVINAADAYKDTIYASEPNTIPAGESLICSLAMQDKKLNKSLRYPAEDMKYEKEEMDKLGL